jgi:hypothetical protein
VIETSPSLLLIHWHICLVFMNTMDMGVFLFVQNMFGTTYVAIKICNFKVPSHYLRLSFYLQAGCRGSHHYWKKLGILMDAYYHQEVILFTAILCAHVCGTSQNAFQLY